MTLHAIIERGHVLPDDRLTALVRRDASMYRAPLVYAVWVDADAWRAVGCRRLDELVGYIAATDPVPPHALVTPSGVIELPAMTPHAAQYVRIEDHHA